MADEHQLDDSDFGISGIEKSQGFETMPVAHPAPSTDDLPTAAADSSNWLQTEDERRHHLRPAPPEPEVREYRNVQTGESILENQTVSAEQAAHDVGLARESERAAREQREQDDLKFALDQLPQDGQPPQQPPVQPTEPQPGLDGVQPEMTAEQALYEQADKELETALQNPLLREKISAEFSQVQAAADAKVAQAAQAIEQHRLAYEHGLAQNVMIGLAAVNAAFPSLAGMNADQIAGALRMMPPQEAERYRQHVGLVTTMAGEYQRAVGAQQAQQQAYTAHQERQSAEAFQRYAAEQDAKAFSKETPESMAKIRNFLYADAEKAGISRAQLEQTWNSVPALRNAFTSELVADGVRWRMAQRGLTEARHATVPKVMRPGVSVSGPSDNSEYASLERSFRGKDLSAKQAADLLIAHRARR